MDFNVPEVIVEDQETISNTAKTLAQFTGITAANVDASSKLYLHVNTNAVRLFYGGTVPTVSNGIRIAANNSFVLYGSDNITNFKIIRDASLDSEVVVVLEG
jgi:hypothetical protein